MANDKKFIVKNGLVTQNIDYVSPDNANTIAATMLDSDTLSFDSDSGQLFSITDSFTGTIFSVNDANGIPSIEVDDDGTVRLAEFVGTVLIGTATDNGVDKLQVNGSISGDGSNLTKISVPTTDAPPSNPADGELWWDSADGNLCVYYADGDSDQWVIAVPTLGPTGPIGPDGLNATLEVGNVTSTRNPSQSPTVNNSGTLQEATFDFNFSRNPTFSVGTVTNTSSPSVTLNTNSNGDVTLDFGLEKGEGVAAGGATGEVLVKNSSTNFDTSWAPASSTELFTATVTGSNGSSNWSGNDPYVATITVSGIESADTPLISLDVSSETYDDGLFLQSVWNLVYRGEVSANNQIKLYAIGEPVPDLNLIIKVTR